MRNSHWPTRWISGCRGGHSEGKAKAVRVLRLGEAFLLLLRPNRRPWKCYAGEGVSRLQHSIGSWKMEGIRVSGRGICLGGKRFWQLAVFAATGTLGVTSQAEAAIYYWQDSAPAAVAEPAPKAPARQTKTHRLGEKKFGEKKSAVVEKESKPQGPLIISISIAQQ